MQGNREKVATHQCKSKNRQNDHRQEKFLKITKFMSIVLNFREWSIEMHKKTQKGRNKSVTHYINLTGNVEYLKVMIQNWLKGFNNLQRS